MAPEEPAPATVGTMLAAAREARGLSVDDVSAATRVRASLVRAIEADDFSGCGGAVYARGHVRSIAGVLGIDSGPLMAEFDRRTGGAPATERLARQLEPPAARRRRGPAGPAHAEPAPAAPAAQPKPAGVLPPVPPVALSNRRERSFRRQLSGRRGPNWALAMGLALLVVIVLAAVSLLGSSHSSSTAQGGASPQPAASSHSPRATPRARPTVTATSAPSNSLADAGVNVSVRLLTASSWVHVQDQSGHVLFQGTLAPGTSQQFHASSQLAFVIGNAGAVDVTVNGRDIGVLGPAGSVRNPVFTAGSTSVG